MIYANFCGQAKPSILFNRDYLELHPGVVLIHEFLGYDPDALVVVLDGLRVLETVELDFQTVVQVTALGWIVHPAVELEVVLDMSIPIPAVALDVEVPLVRLKRISLAELCVPGNLNDAIAV